MGDHTIGKGLPLSHCIITQDWEEPQMGAAAHSLPTRNKLLAKNEFLKINT